MRSTPPKIYLCLIAIWLGSVALSVAAGNCGVPFRETMWELQLPRLIMGMLAGSALATAGALFQALFRNPLASPYTLGVSSGASLGAAIVIIVTGGGLWHGWPVINLAAFAGALAVVFVVYTIARLQRVPSMAVLLLAGITVGFICSAAIVLLLFLAEKHALGEAVRWMMGSLQIIRFDAIYEAVAALVVTIGIAIYLHRDLDLLMMGEQVAAGRGVHVHRSRTVLFFAASLMTAAIVAHCGPIGFVGLIVPHIVRALLGPSHRHMIPGCALAGAAFLPLCDALARNTLWWISGESRELPVGVLTNILGGAFFLYLLLSRRGRTSLI